MAFALWYNRNDLSAIAGEILRDDLPPAQQAITDEAWLGGFQDWEVAPFAPEVKQEGDADVRYVLVNYPNLSLDRFRSLLYWIADHDTDATYMRAIANDMGGGPGATEPWPPAEEEPPAEQPPASIG